jgi:predicted transcriptional regulator
MKNEGTRNRVIRQGVHKPKQADPKVVNDAEMRDIVECTLRFLVNEKVLTNKELSRLLPKAVRGVPVELARKNAPPPPPSIPQAELMAEAITPVHRLVSMASRDGEVPPTSEDFTNKVVAGLERRYGPAPDVVEALDKAGFPGRGRKPAWYHALVAKAESFPRPTIKKGGDLHVAGFPPVPRKPAVPVSKSVRHDRIVCLIDGVPRQFLPRYIMAKWGITPEQYRAHFGLPDDYPMTAPSVAETKRVLAVEQGLGTKKARAARSSSANGENGA